MPIAPHENSAKHNAAFVPYGNWRQLLATQEHGRAGARDTAFREAVNRSIPRADLSLGAWDWIKASAPSGLRAPHVDVREDGGALLTWDLGEHHLDVEINADTTLDFFYLNRQTAEAWNVESTEENPIPRSVRAVLDYFITPATATDNAPPRP